jgi:hypothetical protein
MRRAAWLLVSVWALGCPAPGSPGAPCRKHEDCDPVAEAYCARAEICTRECRADFPCPEGSVCVPQPRRSVCLPACAKDGDCAAGFSCREGACQVTDVLAPPATK